MTNLRNIKKANNLGLRAKKQNERKKKLFKNVIKRSRTIEKLSNTKIKKKLLNKSKKTTEKRIKKIRSLGFKTDSILKQIIEDVIEDGYKILFKEFGKTGERIAFNILNHMAEFDNITIYRQEIRDERRQRLRNNQN